MPAVGYLENQAGTFQGLSDRRAVMMMRTTFSRFLAGAGLATVLLLVSEASASSFSDCSDCPEMLRVPAGVFLMGADSAEEDREALPQAFRGRSLPRHRVAIQAFAAAKHEITRKQYQVFADATGREAAGCFSWNGGDYRLDPAKNWRNPGFPQNDTHPAVCISWEDAGAYAQWLSARTGKRYRLLTEAEWEYAARGGTAFSRFWGEEGDRSCGYANGADLQTLSGMAEAGDWSYSRCNDGHVHTAPVGSFEANAFGLHDMLGNAAEWTADCWNENHEGATSNGAARIDGECEMRVVRGGAWDEGPLSIRSAYRVGSPVVIRVYGRGFRVAVSF